MTRPLDDNKEIILRFKDLGHKVSHMPLIEIEKVNFDDINLLKKFDNIVSDLVIELRDAFDFREKNKSSVCVFNYQKETSVDTVKLN